MKYVIELIGEYNTYSLMDLDDDCFQKMREMAIKIARACDGDDCSLMNLWRFKDDSDYFYIDNLNNGDAHLVSEYLHSHWNNLTKNELILVVDSSEYISEV